jgi:formylglycine-generating enzyme required for sulfatase activity
MRLLALSLVCMGAFASSPDEMVTVPGGEFTMGRTKLTSDDKTNMRPHVLLDDRPARKVTVSSFRLDKHEVTNRQYAAFVQSTHHTPPYHWPGGSYAQDAAEIPVYNVSWADANAYCTWVGNRLPTEAEWEHAARGNKEQMDYPWGDQPDVKKARYNVTSGPGPVGKFPPNDFGLFDMAGNVAEWTADWFDGEYYKRNENTDPKGPAAGDYKVIRGGAWSDSPRRITVFFRNWVRPTQRTPNIGFRCAQ